MKSNFLWDSDKHPFDGKEYAPSINQLESQRELLKNARSLQEEIHASESIQWITTDMIRNKTNNWISLLMILLERISTQEWCENIIMWITNIPNPNIWETNNHIFSLIIKVVRDRINELENGNEYEY